ncbi:recombination-associated protein RdgC [Alkalimarinus alittae]|uniref:Recombination-associated protein RdgC n=1 Tax=Alkalimarinus alittae TaxID=2961619 RepID=A0ABY6N6B2_9ALTE|nr:recombination-associated protein RdgC [Alkalimarinus alittae]UZE97570.1 recombination-associated protein RdgC [Alkalimarinus alittae]
MWFKNIIAYRFTKPFTLSEEALEQKLEESPFTPCGPTEVNRQGWVSPLGRHGQQLVHVTNGHWMICLKREDRLVPSTVVKEAVAEKVAEIEETQMRKVTKKEKDELKEQITHELLPRAFTRSKHTYAYLSPKDGFLIVNASSAKAADDITSYLRKTIGSLPIRIPAVNQAPAAVMTSWLTKDALMPTGFEAEPECELRDPGEEGGVVRCKGVELDGEEISTHLDAGKQAVKLAMTWEQNISFVMNEDLSIKRLKFGDVMQEQLDDSGAEDAASKFDASFAIMSMEFAKLLPAVLDAFGGEDKSAIIEE